MSETTQRQKSSRPEAPPQNSDVEEAKMAAQELLRSPEEYIDVIRVIRQGGDFSVITKEIAEALAEGGRDLRAITPMIDSTTRALKDGVHTSEFKMLSSVNKILTVIAILAPVIEGAIAGIQAFYHQPGDPSASFGGSMVLTGISIFLKTFIANKYATGRVEIKQSAVRAIPIEMKVEQS